MAQPDGGADRFALAIDAIDAANADDPNTLVVDGVTQPKEQAHAELMTHWVQQLDPEATEAQLLAARAHHLRRWSLPRADFPEGRAGYLRWRTTLNKQHAAEVGEILRGVGYGDDVVETVQRIIRKQGLATDPAVQTHEDALCLVFLSTQLGPVAAQLGDEKGTDVVQKTVAKMSERGRREALLLDLVPAEAQLVAAAVATTGP